MATTSTSGNRGVTQDMSVNALFDRAVQRAVWEWLDMHGEAIIAKAAQQSVNAWIMLYDDQIIPGLAEALHRKLLEK